jgi:hypothetical protein
VNDNWPCESMNILLTNVALSQDHEYLDLINAWQKRHHIVATMPSERIVGYLRWDLASSLAAIDVIVCYAEAPPGTVNYYPVMRALQMAEAIQALPEDCAMGDGRKWKSLPFIIISEGPYFFAEGEALERTNARLMQPAPYYPAVLLGKIQSVVDDYVSRILDDYQNLGMIVQFKRGHAQIGPALRKKSSDAESSYYYAPADRRRNRRWLTVMRDNQGLQADVELFQELLDRNVIETQMQQFFEEHPLFLMQARLGIPIPHPLYSVPRRYAADFAIAPVLGPVDGNGVEMLELKGPPEQLLNTDKRHRGFSSKVHRAVDQVRDYSRYMKDPRNFERLIRQFGYLPTASNLAVLIGREPRDDAGKETAELRRSELNAKVITYDEILQTQANQLSRVDLQGKTLAGSLILPYSGF